MSTSTRYRIEEPRPYVIHDRPDESAPASRLIREGGDVLSVSELVAVAIGSTSALDKHIHDYGSTFLKGLRTVQETSEALHIDQVQATRLLAVIALGRRLYEPSQGSMPVLRDGQDVFVHTRTMANLGREQLKVLLLNSRYQLVHEEVLSVGSTDFLQVQPRDVYQAAVERRVPAIILVHNHPSDNPTPSESDKEFSRRIAETGRLLGIELLDHLVVTHDTYESCLN